MMNLGGIALIKIKERLILDILKDLNKDIKNDNNKLLDLGCGEKPYKKIYKEYFNSCIGIDVPYCMHDKSEIDVFGTSETLPFKDELFDIILFTDVLEHVANPLKVLLEVSRVLKKNGTLIITIPFLVPLHEQPYDFYRFTPFSIKILLSNAGLKLINIVHLGESLLVSFSFLNQIYLKGWYVLSKLLRIKVLYCMWNPFILIFSSLPQIIYAFYAKRSMVKQRGFLYWWYKKMNYTCKGFFVLAKK